MESAINLLLERKRVHEFCRTNRIKRLALFGSALRSDFRPESDVDLLVEFEPEARVSFFKLADVQEGLREFFPGREIDLVTVKSLSPLFAETVLAEARVIYGEE